MIRQADGDSCTLLIRRLRCGDCGRVHHELPDIVVPYKRYDSETIEEILSPKDNSPSFPGETSTASRLRLWFLLLRGYFEGTRQAVLLLALQSASERIQGNDPESSGVSGKAAPGAGVSRNPCRKCTA